jgi:hypothetical protein
MSNPAGDEHMGAFVYCASHLRSHSTGWCTVSAEDKIPLGVTTPDEAHSMCERLGLSIFDFNAERTPLTVERFRHMRPLAQACQQRHPRSWLTPEPYRSQRDRILRRLAEIRAENGGS